MNTFMIPDAPQGAVVVVRIYAKRQHGNSAPLASPVDRPHDPPSMAQPQPDSTPTASPPWASRQNSRPGPKAKRLAPWLLLLALVVGLVWAMRPAAIEVETAAIANGSLTVHVTEEGKTRIRNRYIVAAPAAGTMLRVSLKAGDPVDAGVTRLTAIDPTSTPLLDPRSRAQAESALSLREAARMRAAQVLEALQAALDLAIRERDRVRAVGRTGTLSESDRDRSEADALIKAAEARAAEFALQVAAFEVDQARMNLERPTATGAANRIELVSPVSGVVLKVMQESETTIAAGTPILEIGDPKDLEIEAEILSQDAVGIRPGDAVEVVQWGGEGVLAARVRRIEPAAFTKVSALGVEEQRVLVLCDLENPPEDGTALGDRYRVETRIAVWRGEDVVLAPAGALFRRGNQSHAFVLADGRARLIHVDAGPTDGRMTSIRSGLKPGDLVLLHPPDVVEDGSRVVAREAGE
jgi:HlyD family secretion protein